MPIITPNPVRPRSTTPQTDITRAKGDSASAKKADSLFPGFGKKTDPKDAGNPETVMDISPQVDRMNLKKSKGNKKLGSILGDATTPPPKEQSDIDENPENQDEK